MKFNIDYTLGDQTANLIFLVKYYNANEPENSGFDFFIANDDEHLKSLVKDVLSERFSNGEWSCTEPDELESDNFESHFESEWDNKWITFHQVGTRITN